VDEAAATLADAQAIAERNGERFYEPELHRLSAEVLHAAGGPDDEVERRFRRGLDVARACGAQALELRAALGLGRRFAAAGRGDDARALVRAALPAPTKRADTRDVRDACALLGESP
jgi:adenylate cyclase